MGCIIISKCYNILIKKKKDNMTFQKKKKGEHDQTRNLNEKKKREN